MSPDQYEREATMTVSTTAMPERVRTGDLYGILRSMIKVGKGADALKKQLMYEKFRFPPVLPELNSIKHIIDEMDEEGIEKREAIIGILHSYCGMTSELGELAESILISLQERKPIDRVNWKEELGDISWYMVRGMRAISLTFTNVWSANIAKLRRRYGTEFNPTASLEKGRDRDAEKKILES